MKTHYENEFLDAISELSGARNNLIFLHVNCKGEQFYTIHKLTEEYYKKIADDLDYVLELYVISTHKDAPNLNSLSSSFIIDNVYLTDSVGSVITTIEYIVEALKCLRDVLDESANITKIDEMLEYWIKQCRFILPKMTQL